jgi:hypothetical protein
MRRCGAADGTPPAGKARRPRLKLTKTSLKINVHYLFFVRNMFFLEFATGTQRSATG